MSFKKIVLFIVIIFWGCIIFDFFINPYINKPKIGQIWRWTRNDNPFSKLKPYYDYKVLDVKKGYVLYMDINDSSIDNSTIRMFKLNAECIYDSTK